jgi:hypothetical protein
MFFLAQATSSCSALALPLHQILQDIDQCSFITLPQNTTSTINNSSLSPSRIYEDNAACIVLATTNTNFKPRTKLFSIKWHHFWDQIQNGSLTILKVATDDNITDIFTKPLVKFKF